jgi:tight adherence protein B
MRQSKSASSDAIDKVSADNVRARPITSSGRSAQVRPITSSGRSAQVRPITSSGRRKQIASLALTLIVAFPLSLLLTQSMVMAAAISTVALALPIELTRLSFAKAVKAEREAWPAVIDHLISAVGTGLSLSHALNDLAERGPKVLIPQFSRIKQDLENGVPFHEALRRGKQSFRTSAADQVLEVLIIARVTGSSNTGTILRTLGEFLRQENAMRAEIEARHGWVRSSASLAAIAPWALLVILSAQQSTRAAFTTPTGLYILFIGVAMTAVAYTWMNLVGRLPEVPRALG